MPRADSIRFDFSDIVLTQLSSGKDARGTDGYLEGSRSLSSISFLSEVTSESSLVDPWMPEIIPGEESSLSKHKLTFQVVVESFELTF